MVNGETSLRVPVVRLDDLDLPPSRVQLLKLDVEGYEKLVLEGATGVLERTDCVFVEVCAKHFAWFGYTTRDLLTLLVEAGFHVLRPDGPGSLVRVELEYEPADFENLVAVRDLDTLAERTGWRVS